MIIKITIIAPYAFGYIQHIKESLALYKNIDVDIIYLDKPEFEYKNPFHRLQNSILKLVLKKNLKKQFVFERVKSSLKKRSNQDIIFMVRPDMLDDKTLKYVRSFSDKLIAYYWDSIQRFPRKEDILPFFDKVYSYDRNDVTKFNLKFLTNFTFEEEIKKAEDYLFFNISTNDNRLGSLEKLAKYIDERGWSKKILVYNSKKIQVENVELIMQQKTIKEVSKLLNRCKIIVEIQRKDQIGLSFRVFEALANEKKLITTNSDIINYDFYNPQNILVLDEDAIEIPENFVNTPYQKIDTNILSKYRVENWIKPIFNLQ